jgi:hypothetical protein
MEPASAAAGAFHSITTAHTCIKKARCFEQNTWYAYVCGHQKRMFHFNLKEVFSYFFFSKAANEAARAEKSKARTEAEAETILLLQAAKAQAEVDIKEPRAVKFQAAAVPVNNGVNAKRTERQGTCLVND